ncbi:hypothetical protein H8B09_18610 [Paenibacillus sp. PR3]|uniref:Lipoprotein n=1 Tax=Paenibacillus terricola TaxID=2763503 RepID=A0ABR8MYX4_9BACL|nr:hypothetical protein [Paenibacillus terricola]MBD3920785.1 hypothetical protein [Paenibacillus terricola]
MKQSKWAYSIKAAAALLLAASILSACGSKNDNSNGASNGGQAASQQQGQNGQGGGFRQMASAPNQPERQADLFAKIVSIDGTSFVVKQADMSSMQQRGQGGGRNGHSNGQDIGQMQPPADGQMPQGSPPADSQAPQGDGQMQPPADGQAPQGGGNGSGQARSMPDFFTGEESTISISEGTAIYKLVRGDDGTMNYEQVKLADLAADDIINVWLKSGTKEAEYVSLSGGFGGGFGFGGGGMRGNGNGQNGGQTNNNANAQTTS